MSGSDAYDLLRAVKEVAGPEVADAFRDATAGRRLYIPKNQFKSKQGVIVKAVGSLEKANLILCALKDLGITNLHITMPLGSKGHVYRTALAIRDALMKGDKSTSEIAMQFGVTERCIFIHRRILRESGEVTKIQPARKIVLSEPDLSEVDLDIATSPSLDEDALQSIATQYKLTVFDVEDRVRRLRFRGFLNASTEVAVNG